MAETTILGQLSIEDRGGRKPRNVLRRRSELGTKLDACRDRDLRPQQTCGGQRKGGQGQTVGLFGGGDGPHHSVGPDLAVHVGGGIGTAKNIEGQQPPVTVAERRPERVRDLGQGVGEGEITGGLGGLGEDEIEDDGSGAEIIDSRHQAGEALAGPGKGAALDEGDVVDENGDDRRFGPQAEARCPKQQIAGAAFHRRQPAGQPQDCDNRHRDQGESYC